MNIRLIASALVATLLAGCNSNAAMDNSVEYTVLANVETFGNFPREIRVISDQQSLELVWARFQGIAGPVPNIDFQTREVLYANLGGISGGGYSVTVTKMELQEVPDTIHQAIVARLHSTLQRTECGAVGATLYPTMVASYEKIERAVLFVQETVSAGLPCPR